MKAILDNIIVKPCASENISEGGLYVPEAFKERSNKAILISVGGGTKKHPKTLNEGDTVFHVKGAGTEIEKDGEKYYIMKSWDVLAHIPLN